MSKCEVLNCEEEGYPYKVENRTYSLCEKHIKYVHGLIIKYCGIGGRK
jgi:hypothetical protein